MIKIRLLVITVLILICKSVNADPGLSSLEGLKYFYLIAVIVFIIITAFVVYLLSMAYRLTRKKNDKTSKQKGIAIFTILGLISFILMQPIIDFNLYILVDNDYPEATTITSAHVERYFEVDDGRHFYLVKNGLRYFKPGRKVVIRDDKTSKTKVSVYDIFEASGGYMFFRERKRTEGKKLWIPILPVTKKRFQLTNRGPILLLTNDWHIDDLAAHTKHIPWCCDATWTKLLLEHGANPSRAIHDRLPLYSALAPMGWVRDEAELNSIELKLEILLSAGVNINATNSYGETALFGATRLSNDKALKWLLTHGANPDIRNKKGDTALDSLHKNAKQFGKYWSKEQKLTHKNMIQYLEQ